MDNILERPIIVGSSTVTRILGGVRQKMHSYQEYRVKDHKPTLAYVVERAKIKVFSRKRRIYSLAI